MGKSILSEVINPNHNTIDLSNLSKGFYVLHIKEESNTKGIKISKE